LGVYRLVLTTRNTKWIAGVEASNRATQSQLGGLNTSDRTDKQIRYKLSSETRQWFVNYIGNEIVFSTGSMNLNKNTSDKTSDETSGAFVHGQYEKLEMSGRLVHNFDKSNLSFSSNWKGQAASKNMDSYNRFSAGGAGGMRGFSSLDGVSDRGGILLLNLNYRINKHFNAGLLYDVGRIRTTDLTTEKTYYTLQNAGVQISGKIADKAFWNITAAKVIGTVPDSAQWTSANSKPGDWRVGASLSVTF
jgi:hemolysin activation/secretion protein